MAEGTRFAFQHDVRRLPDGTISIFDNGSLVFENGLPKAVEESRAIVLDVDERKMRASLAREYTHPDKQYADAAGNAQVLPNGDAFVGWGRALAISEFSREGELLFDLRLPPQNKTYRAFRFPDVWVKRDGRWQVVARSSIFVPRITQNRLRVLSSQDSANFALTEFREGQPRIGSGPFVVMVYR